MSEEVSETMREIAPELDLSGQYSITSTIKEGRLYIATKAGKRFLLKTSDGSAKGLEQLKREYELSISLSHPGLAYVFTYEDTSPVGPCIVQEYVDGRTLSQYLTEKPALNDRKRAFGQILSAVAYLHHKGVIHNDLSPANILVSNRNDDIKVIDLGFADDDTHYLSKSLGGTRKYASPELISGAKVDARSDIYTLGAIIRDMFPGRYGRIAGKCLRQSPERRYSSVENLSKAWRRYYLPLRVFAFFVICAIAVMAFAHQDRSRIAGNKKAAEMVYAFDSLQATMAEMTAVIDSLSSALDSVEAAESARHHALDKAKAEVDAWYEREIPRFRKALSKAATRADINAAWSALVEKMAFINTDLPARTPEEVSPALRDYVFQRYNTDFVPLQDSIIKRMTELSE